MTRIVRIGLLAIPAIALLAGCVLQDPFGLPPLGSGPASSASSSFYYGSGYGAYDPRYGYYGSRYGYPAYRYDPLLGYATPGYAYYYGPGYGYYRPYPRGPYCVDANRDGRCDTRPPRDDDQPPGGGNAGGGNPGGGNAGGGPHDGRDGLGRNPIRRLRDIDRPVPAGAVRTPVSPAPQQQAPPARPPAVSTPPPRAPATARPGPADPPRGRPADGPRIRDLDPPSRSPIAPRTVER